MSAERSAIISVLACDKSPVLTNLVAAGLLPEHFSEPNCRLAWEIMTDLGPEKARDINLVNQEAKERGAYSTSFGSFLMNVLDERPSATDEDCARLIMDAHRRRSLLAACTKAKFILEGDAGLEEATDLLASALRNASLGQSAQLTFTPKDLLPETLLPADDEKSVARHGVDSGYKGLDLMLQGIRPQQMLIIGARPGMGKTILAQNMAEYAAIKGKRVLFFSLEMSPIELAERYLASQMGISYQQVRARILTNHDKELTIGNTAIWHDRLVWHRGVRNMGVNDILAHARACSDKYGKLDLIVVDYLGKLRPKNSMAPLVERVGEIASDLKNAARELDLPFIVVQQLNRAVEGRPNKRPTLADLRDSGVVEQEADIVILLGDEEGQRKAIKAFIEKNRNGELGVVDLEPEFRFQRFAR